MRDAKWKKVHAELTRLARAKGEYDAEEAGWLVEAVRLRVHEQVGYATALEYLDRLFGYGPRMANGECQVSCRQESHRCASPCSGFRRTVAMGVQLRV